MFIREEFFQIIKEAGFDHVRIPVRWSAHASAEYPYNIWPGFLRRVDQVVSQALAQGLTAVINIHHYGELMDNPEEHKERFLALWRQIAEAYRDWPDNLYFSVLNEPMGNLTTELWNEYLVEALRVIRESNPDRMVVIGPANWNAVSHLAFLDWPEGDDNLMATFHYYSPFEFTHQGAGWVDNPPPIGTRWTGTEAEIRAVQRDLDRAVRFAEENDVMVWLAEFGAYSTADMESRALWTSTVVREAEKRGIAWSYWEFGAGFGAFDRNTNAWRQELLDALITQEKPPTAVIDEAVAIEIFNFDTDTQGWAGGEAQPQWGEGKTETMHDKAFFYEGEGSLKVLLTGGANRYKIIAPETIFAKATPGKTFIYRVYIPEDSGVTAIQPYAQYNNWAGWADSYIPDVPEGTWITIDWTIQEGVSQPLNSFGIMVHTGHTNEAYIFIDSVEME
jgi:endoglucanase